MKVFFSAPFSGKIVDGREVDAKYKEKILTLMHIISDSGHNVQCCFFREDFGKALKTPREAVEHDSNDVKWCDIIVAYFEKDISAGVCIELGWASLLKKRIILLCKKGVHIPHLVKGLGRLTKIKLIQYETTTDLFKSLVLEAKKWRQ